MRTNSTCPEKKEAMDWIFNTFKLIHKKSHLVTTGAFSEKQLFLSAASKVGQGNVFGREGIL